MPPVNLQIAQARDQVKKDLITLTTYQQALVANMLRVPAKGGNAGVRSIAAKSQTLRAEVTREINLLCVVQEFLYGHFGEDHVSYRGDKYDTLFNSIARNLAFPPYVDFHARLHLLLGRWVQISHARKRFRADNGGSTEYPQSYNYFFRKINDPADRKVMEFCPTFKDLITMFEANGAFIP